MSSFRLSRPRFVPESLLNMIEAFAGLPQAQQLYQKSQLRMMQGETFASAVLGAMDVHVDTNRHERIRIPRSGACIVCSNHPHGMIDGLLILDIVQQLRSDVKILANASLRVLPELQPLVINVDLESSGISNLRAMKEAMTWLQSGGMLVVFPSAEVSHLGLYACRVQDGPWATQVGKLAVKTRATVVPMYIHGRNSVLFQVAGVIHPRLRTMLLVREFVRKHTHTIRVSVGTLLTPRQYMAHPGHASVIDFIRTRSALLRYKSGEQRGSTDLRMSSGVSIAEAVDRSLLEKEIADLKSDQLLSQQAEFDVYCAKQAQIPQMMREIGRLRELSFRLAGEGTMRSIDVDSFDGYYEHLILWNRDKKEVAGAYRIGRTDDILRRFGARGLYLNTLFELKAEFFRRIGPALELGRSFVRPEYQKNPLALHVLWKGIGAFVANNPQYKCLIGPVSISNDFSKNALRLIVASVLNHHFHLPLARLVRARRPVDRSLYANWDALLRSDNVLPIEHLDGLIENLEWDAKPLPVLLRHYVRLGGKVVAFHRDTDFASCIDALVVLDLRTMDTRIRSKYLGSEGARRYAELHGLVGAEAPTHRRSEPEMATE